MNRSVVVLFALMTGVLPLAGQAPAKAGNAENGKQLYVKVGCYQCHGRQGQGGASAPFGSYGPRLAPPKVPVAAIRAYVRHPSGGMPPYAAKVLSDAQIDDIYAFLKTIPSPPAVKDIPLLNQ
ncbi:MAG: cytochrome c [Acidobacteria bacterium]|nr:cytochrome c [Acidobacteriota bacterium]